MGNICSKGRNREIRTVNTTNDQSGNDTNITSSNIPVSIDVIKKKSKSNDNIAISQENGLKVREMDKSGSSSTSEIAQKKDIGVGGAGTQILAKYLQSRSNLEIDQDASRILLDITDETFVGKELVNNDRGRRESKEIITDDSTELGKHAAEQQEIKLFPAQETKVDIDKFFEDQFLSIVKKRTISDFPLNQPLPFDRRMPVADVMKQWGKEVARTFAVARGMAKIEQSKQTPWVDTTEIFEKRYECKVDKWPITLKHTSDDGASIDSFDAFFQDALHTDPLDNDPSLNDFFRVLVAPKIPEHEEQDLDFARRKDCYINFWKPQEGKFVGKRNYRNLDAEREVQGTYALHNPDINWFSRKAAILEGRKEGIDVSDHFPITNMRGEVNTNKETVATQSLFWSGEGVKEYNKGEDGYFAMLGTPTLYGKLLLLEQHKDTIGHYEIKQIKFGKKSIISKDDVDYIELVTGLTT